MRFVKRIESSTAVMAVRAGLVSVIPLLMAGSFALILRSLPITVYQNFLDSFLNGSIRRILDLIFNATFGMMSVYMTIAISVAYRNIVLKNNRGGVGMPFTAAAVFVILTGGLTSDFSLSSFGVKGMFTALVSALLASWVYLKLKDVATFRRRLYAQGADADFNEAVLVIVPMFLTIALFAAANYALTSLFSVTGFQQLFINAVSSIFDSITTPFLRGLLFVVLSSTMWFFGIHGSDVLEGVTEKLFTPLVVENAAAVASGAQPVHIFTKTFFDVLVLIGGCGSALCLLIALLIWGKLRSNRKLGIFASFPMLFNINELMILGLPVVLNPILMIPFILTPLVFFLTSYLAMSLGVVPLTTVAVEWTTPVLLGGYQATGSIAGSLLQLFNVALGVFIYRPFIKMYEKERTGESKRRLDELIVLLKTDEKTGEDTVLTEMPNSLGAVAKILAADLAYAAESGEIQIYYQPQFDYEESLIGTEALLRWDHADFGFIYPPLVIKLADETGRLEKLEKSIITRAARDSSLIREWFGECSTCINVSVKTLQAPGFCDFLEQLIQQENIKPGELCLEITEQMALSVGERSVEIFEKVKSLGCKLAIDDFSMGHTSIIYLQDSQFDLVKLDGALVHGIEENPRAKEIISSIIHLSKSLDFSVLAEFVDSSELKEELYGVECALYQGYLYSPAVPLDKLRDVAAGHRKSN